MINTNTYIYVGNGSQQSGSKAEQISAKLKIKFHGILDEHTEFLPGAYHTSVYDYNLFKLKTRVAGNDNINLVCLGDTHYDNEYDFYQTQNFLAEMSAQLTVQYTDLSIKNNFINTLFDNKAVCVMPWIAVNQQGDRVNSCCHQLLIPNQTYDVETVKQQMLDGIKPAECQRCYKLEDNNAVSARLKFSSEWSHRSGINSLSQLTNKKDIEFFDFRLDNTCNLMCRTCSPILSSLIEKEYTKLGLFTGTGNKKTVFFTNEQLKSGKRFYFAGGEPLWHPDFLKTLKQMEDIGNLSADIIVNTNAATIPKKVAETLKKFTNISFTISFDGVGDKLTYIRWPIKWEQFCNNAKLLNEISSKPLHFNCVISIYNISNCYAMFKWIEDNYPNSNTNFTILTDPVEQQAKFFPNKEVVLNELKKVKTLNYFSNNEYFSSRVVLMEKLIQDQELDIEALRQFFKFNDLLDESRNCNLLDYIPELDKCRQ